MRDLEDTMGTGALGVDDTLCAARSRPINIEGTIETTSRTRDTLAIEVGEEIDMVEIYENTTIKGKGEKGKRRSAVDLQRTCGRTIASRLRRHPRTLPRPGHAGNDAGWETGRRRCTGGADGGAERGAEAYLAARGARSCRCAERRRAP